MDLKSIDTFRLPMLMKILLFGLPGSGKTTMAKSLGELYKMPIFHLDKMFLDANRNKVSAEDGTQIVGDILQKFDSRIIEGNYLSTDMSRIQYADHIFLLHVARRKCLWRVLMRLLKSRFGFYDGSKPEGIVESFDLQFYKWILTYPLEKKLHEVCQTYGKIVQNIYKVGDIVTFLEGKGEDQQ